jgi:hypothetical protein
VEKYSTSGEATDDNTAHVHFTQTHALRICNTYCLSTATTVAHASQCYTICIIPVLLHLTILPTRQLELKYVATGNVTNYLIIIIISCDDV